MEYQGEEHVPLQMVWGSTNHLNVVNHADVRRPVDICSVLSRRPRTMIEASARPFCNCRMHITISQKHIAISHS